MDLFARHGWNFRNRLFYSSSFVPFSSMAQNFVFEIPWNVLVLLVIKE
jgi:hypothetical protein